MFKAGAYSDLSTHADGGTQEFTIQLVESKTIHSILIVNAHENMTEKGWIGVSHVRIGDDNSDYSMINTKVKDNIINGGLFKLDSLTTGSVINLRRDGSPGVWPWVTPVYKIHELRAYEMPNLLEEF